MTLDKVKEVVVLNYTNQKFTIGVCILDGDQLRVHIGNWKPDSKEKTLHDLGYPHKIGVACEDYVSFQSNEIEDIESTGE